MQVPVYIAEITPKNLRGGFTALHEVHVQLKIKNLLGASFWCYAYATLFLKFVLGCSSSIAYLIGSLVNWRIFALLGKFFELLLSQFYREYHGGLSLFVLIFRIDSLPDTVFWPSIHSWVPKVAGKPNTFRLENPIVDCIKQSFQVIVIQW